MVTITFLDYHMIVVNGNGETSRYSLDYEAYSHGDEVGIRHIWLKDVEVFKGRVRYDGITVNGTVHTSAANTVADINAYTAAALAYLLTGMRANSNYPNNAFSAEITANAETQIANYPYRGYVTLKAPSTNAGNVYVGPQGLGAGSGNLEPGESVAYELDDLSSLYALNASNNDVLEVFGAYVH